MEYETEEQQVEALKSWWRENGRSVLLGIGIGAAAIIGWQGWTKYQQSQAESASDTYSESLNALATGDATAATAAAATVRDEHGNSMYATLAALAAARAHVENDDLDAAATELRWAVKNSPQAEVATVARIRLARVLAEAGKHEDALKQLPAKPPKEFAALVDEARGDIYVATGDLDAARTAYRAAQQSGQRSGNSSLLEMKLNDIAAPEDAS